MTVWMAIQRPGENALSYVTIKPIDAEITNFDTADR